MARGLGSGFDLWLVTITHVDDQARRCDLGTLGRIEGQALGLCARRSQVDDADVSAADVADELRERVSGSSHDEGMGLRGWGGAVIGALARAAVRVAGAAGGGVPGGGLLVGA